MEASRVKAVISGKRYETKLSNLRDQLPAAGYRLPVAVNVEGFNWIAVCPVQ